VLSVASRDGYRYLGIVMRAPYKDAEGNIIKGKESSAFIDCRKMFDWAFDNLKLETVADPDQIVSEVQVKLSFQTDYIRLLPKGEVRALVPQGLDTAGVMIEPNENMPKTIDAPVKKGEVVGQANILYAGQVIGTVDLVAEKDARRSLILYVGNLLKKGIQSTAGKIILAAAALVVVFVVLVNVLYYYKKKKMRIRVVRGYRNVKKGKK
jgi:D-alanyl-D-alanine carboxypeptidase (penicillin-binding protein 5/6)